MQGVLHPLTPARYLENKEEGAGVASFFGGPVNVRLGAQRL